MDEGQLHWAAKLAMVVAAIATVAVGSSVKAAATASFAEFDRRAREGERLNVVFFGASLTWGANASDPQLTSYRGLIGNRLEAAYPQARFKFWDAAIGGTGSQLGVFRFDRDVLRRKPDLVFLDFSANDGIESDRRETLASYESLVRRVIVEARCPVVQVVFPFKWNVATGVLDRMLRRTAHYEIAAAYHSAIGDAIALAHERVEAGKITVQQIWPLDGAHPCDTGYALFADAAWSAFQEAVKAARVCQAPDEMLYGDTYMTRARVRLSSLGPLPAGWRIGAPNVVSAYFDMLMSRWLDDEVIAGGKPKLAGGEPPSNGDVPSRLKVRFRGSMVMLLGEATPKSGPYRVYLDGKLVEHREGDEKSPLLQEFTPGNFARRLSGNAHHAPVIAEGLDPTTEHTLEIEPAFTSPDQELRLESVCVAGGAAMVRAAE